MTAAELDSLACSIYGDRWQHSLARETGIEPRIVRHWAADGVPEPVTSAELRSFLSCRATLRLAGPTAGMDDNARDDLAVAECSPLVAALIGSGEEAGFHEAELLAALISIVTNRMARGAGIPATIETLRLALADLKDQWDT